MLAERLRNETPKIISSPHSAFNGGRQTSNPVLVANEIVGKDRLKKKGWILKLDLTKAFDGVAWNFLDEFLLPKGFNFKCIS